MKYIVVQDYENDRLYWTGSKDDFSDYDISDAYLFNLRASAEKVAAEQGGSVLEMPDTEEEKLSYAAPQAIRALRERLDDMKDEGFSRQAIDDYELALTFLLEKFGEPNASK